MCFIIVCEQLASRETRTLERVNMSNAKSTKGARKSRKSAKAPEAILIHEQAPETQVSSEQQVETQAPAAPVVEQSAPQASSEQKAPETNAAPAPIVKKEHANGAAFTNQRPGVLAHIENLLRAASAEAPISKAEILASLVVAFADREEAKMKTTVAMQVPSGFKIEKGYIITKVEGRGYYFDVEKTREYQATHEKKGAKWAPKVTQ